MREPGQHLLDAFDTRPLGQRGAFDHDDGKPELSRRIDLGASAGAAGVAGHQKFDGARAHQFAVALKREGTARDDDLGIGQRQRPIGCVDKAQRIGMLRFHGEGREMLPADGEKDARAFFRQRRSRGVDISDLDPMVGRGANPWRALQRQQRNACCCAGLDRMPAHLGGERMRRVDDMRDALPADEVCKPGHTAEAADPGRQRMAERNLRASGVGINSVDLLADKPVRKPVGVTCSAQNEGAHA
jgi:hypothetical protein